MSTAGSITIDVILNGKKAQMGLKDFSKQLNSINKTTQKTGKLFSGLAKTLASLGAVALFSKAAQSASEFGYAMSLMAQKTGIASANLANMRTAFSAWGVEAKNVDGAISNLSKGLNSLKLGGDQTGISNKLMHLGISAWGPGGKVKNADEVLFEIADVLAGNPRFRTPEIRDWLERELGLSQGVIRQLEKGSKALKAEMAATTARTGEYTEDDLSKLEKTKRAFSELKTIWTTTMNKTIADLSDYLIPTLQALGDVAKLISDALKVAVEMVTSAVDWLVSTILDIYRFFAKLFEKDMAAQISIARMGVYKEGKEKNWTAEQKQDEFLKRVVPIVAKFGKGSNEEKARLVNQILDGQGFLSEKAKLNIIYTYDDWDKEKSNIIYTYEDWDEAQSLEQATSDGTPIYVDIDSDVNVDRNGNVKQSIDVNGISNNGENHVSMNYGQLSGSMG